MSDRIATEFFHFLSGLTPGWALAFVLGAIFIYRFHLIEREFFAGVARLRNGLRVRGPRTSVAQQGSRTGSSASTSSPAQIDDVQVETLPSAPRSRRA
jgi:hypothetical protein